MLKFVRKFFGATKAAILWLKAVNHASASEYQKALFTLYRVYAALGANGPCERATPELNLLFAHVAAKLGDDALVTEATRVTLSGLDTAKGYSEAERNYLRYCAAVILEWRDISFDDMAFEPPSFSDLRFDQVRDSIKRTFPVTDPLAPQQTTLH